MNSRQESLPYFDGDESSSGHAGSDTSRERAESDDRSGRTRRRQQRVLELLAQAGTNGVTVVELRQHRDRGRVETQMHHGQASAVLSNLHKDGKIVRLAERRGKAKVYVLPRYVMERKTEPHGNVSATEMLDEMHALLNQAALGTANGWEDDRACHNWQEQADDVMRRYEATRK